MQELAPSVLNGARLVGNYAPGSPEWHSERSKGIGGSEVGTILGLNPYESPYALWAKKTKRIPSEIQENWAIRFGKAFEEPILYLWQEEHPEWDLYTTGTYADEFCDYLHANPDAIAVHKKTGEQMIIEVKTARQTWENVPPSYIAQVMHYMGVTKIQRGLIVAVAGMTWNEYEVPFNQQQIDHQNKQIAEFWNSVQEDKRPDWDGAESTYHAVRMQYDSIEAVEVDLGELGREVLELQMKADDAYWKLSQAKSKALDAMETAKWGTYTTPSGEVVRVASRQMRAGNPVLVINKKGISWI